jgi:prepilin-type N-terminal cleavage/methylation domain-containing protein
MTNFTQNQPPETSSPAPDQGGLTPPKAHGQAGFSLIELIVSIAIFAIVTTVALVGLLSVIDASRQTRASADAVDNLNFVVDDMIRRIRTGYDFDCGSSGGGDCTGTGGSNNFYFTSSEVGEAFGDNPRVRYYVDSGQIKRTITSSAGSDTIQLTAPPLENIDLRFQVTGSPDSDREQSRVLIYLEGEVAAGDSAQSFRLQTTVSQRLLFNPS